MSAVKAERGAPLLFLHEVVAQSPQDDCVLWPYALTNGYGALHIDGRARKAHQVAWELLRDMPFPMRMHSRHLCGTPACVNPVHVTPGTAAQNSADEDRLGRRIRGEHAGGAKLTWRDADRIRWRLADGEMQSEIAADLGVSASTIRLVAGNRIWLPEHDPRSGLERADSRLDFLQEKRRRLTTHIEVIDIEAAAIRNEAKA